jgi:uncharacterized membrane-anchored protein
LVLLGSGAAAQEAREEDTAKRLAAIGFREGPLEGDLGGMATIPVPEGYRFVGKGGAGKFMEMTGNLSDGSELGVLLSGDNSWFVVFEFSDEGYIKDEDRDLDADAILASIKEGTSEANKVRRERGWATLEVVGWHQKPFYDPQTHNLTWAIIGSSENSRSINHSTRMLGRKGVLRVNLVLSPEDVDKAVPAFNSLLGGFSFNQGHRYAEFRSGDKVAQYGLTGLIVGGAGVALVKTGLLQKLWKPIVLGLLAIAGAMRRFVGGLFRRGQPANQSPNG